jgi:hypothetical protein
MLDLKLNRKQYQVVMGMSVFSLLLFTGCAKRGNGGNGVTAQGTISLDTVKVGMPESTFKDAMITFVPDVKPNAITNGKTQYLSRIMNPKKGQFVVECKDGNCFWLEVKYPADSPITKDEGLENLKQLLPADAPAQTKVDDSTFKAKHEEIIEYADKYTGMIEFADSANDKVVSVSAFNLAPDEVRKGLLSMGKPVVKPGAAATTTTTKSKKGKGKAAAPAADVTTTSTDTSAAPATTTTTSTTTAE